MFPRSSGVLLHATSLPGGRLGPEAYRFVDFLAAAGQRWWQLLPIAPPGAGRSPYSALSAFAGSETLLERGPGAPAAYDAPWLEDYALFRALHDEHGGPWTSWSAGLRDRTPRALGHARDALTRRIRHHIRVQQVFMEQWLALKRYANDKGIGLIGDVALFVAHDSADVWANRGLFKLKPNGKPDRIAGVPPDYFSEDGQLWGSPVYRWPEMKRAKFAWWIARMRRMFELFDAVRLDHFLGFQRGWEVSARARTAKNGEWVKGPRAAFFKALRNALGQKLRPLIAEDLGLRTPASDALRERFGLPGMRILQFSFGPNAEDRPHYFPRNSVVYTGTHDNDTTKGWFRNAGDDGERARRYAGCRRDHIAWGMVRAAHLCPADLAIVPAQDLLGLGSRARMNMPGTVGRNWTWRLKPRVLDGRLARRLRELTEVANR